MQQIIKTQEEFDKLNNRVEKEQDIVVECEVRLNSILEVFGKILFKRRTDCSSFYGNRYIRAYGDSSVVARDNSSVEARDNSSVEAWDNSSVVARDNSSVEARDNSSVEARDNSSVVAYEKSSVVAYEKSSVVAYEKSSVVAYEKSSVEARDNSSVEARDNSSVEARDNSSVEARDNSSVVAWDNSIVRLFSDLAKIKLYGFSVLFKDISLKVKINIKSKNAIIQNIKELPYLEREAIEVKKGKVILYKKVSIDFKTQENTKNETLWTIGTTLEHTNYNPKTEECGEGKYHACSRPYFCDEFRNNQGDRYIAIEVNIKDLYEWKKPAYPHKIAFRKCKVLKEVNKFGKDI
jgi:hypothetical protein